MPIKPENRDRYPADWPAISLAAKERAGWKCQHPGCVAKQYSVGTWGRECPSLTAPWHWFPVRGNRPPTTGQDNEFDNAGMGCDFMGDRWTYGAAKAFIDRFWTPDEDGCPIVIVLTVAHLNHEPEDCRPENLAAMCQRHHLAYDREHHLANAQATRRSRKAIGELF